MKFRAALDDVTGEEVDPLMQNAAVHPTCREFVYLEFFHLKADENNRVKTITV